MAFEHIRQQETRRKYSVAIHEHRVRGTYRDFVQYQARCLNCTWLGPLHDTSQDAVKDAKRHGVKHAKNDDQPAVESRSK